MEANKVLFILKNCMLKKTLNANSEKQSELVCFRKRPANLFTQESVSDLSKLSQVSVGGRENALIESVREIMSRSTAFLTAFFCW